MTRKEKLTQLLDLRGSVGIEVGRLDKPIVSKEEGNIFYVDFCETEELRTRWKDDPGVNCNRIWVDAVWGTNSLADAVSTSAERTGQRWTGADYLLASHVIEHVPDFITWLNEAKATLKPHGQIRLAVPDRRFTFDYLRNETRVEDVVTEFVRRRRAPSAARIIDFALNVTHVDCGEAWKGPIAKERLVKMYSPEGAIAIAHDAEVNNAYHDIHCWVFTPYSFTQLMMDLTELELLDLGCEWIIPTIHNDLEFFVCMTPLQDKSATMESWRKAQLSLDGEQFNVSNRRGAFSH